MKGFARFEYECATVGEAHIMPLFTEALANAPERPPAPFDVSIPFTHPQRPNLTRDQRFFSVAFSGFVEIGETVNRLEDIEVYLRRFPFRGTRVSRERYMRHHIESYFHELHILRERLVQYATRLGRAYRKSPTGPRAAAMTAHTIALATGALEKATRIRGRHVHESRFDETHLTNLGALELVALNFADPILQPFLETQYRKARKYWVAWTIRITHEVRQLVDQYFDLIYPVLFASPGKLRYP